jgi:hypothetical protein
MYDNYLFINHIKLKTVFKMENYVPPVPVVGGVAIPAGVLSDPL